MTVDCEHTVEVDVGNHATYVQVHVDVPVLHTNKSISSYDVRARRCMIYISKSHRCQPTSLADINWLYWSHSLASYSPMAEREGNMVQVPLK